MGINFFILRFTHLYFFVLAAVINILIVDKSVAQIQNQKCLICHGKTDFKVVNEDGSIRKLYVDEKVIKQSPHFNNSCQDCHSDIVEITALGHKKNVKKVNCTRCHYDNNPVGAPETERYREFQESVHYQELMKGNSKAPNCQSCHGEHNIVSKKSLTTLELKQRITKNCGKCHIDIYKDFSTSIHGVALFEKNIVDVPSCSDCHGEHRVKKSEDPSATISKTQLYYTCGYCHASEKIVSKYGISADKFKTYEKSYHGIAVQFGEKTVANCASCHGVHDIKPQTDPSSSIHPNNIVKTCGKCHPDANANYAKGQIHIDPHSKEAGSIYYISTFFKWLTITTITLLFLHVILDLIRKLKHKRHSTKA